MQAHRVLRPGGVFVLVTSSSKHFQLGDRMAKAEGVVWKLSQKECHTKHGVKYVIHECIKEIAPPLTDLERFSLETYAKLGLR